MILRACFKGDQNWILLSLTGECRDCEAGKYCEDPGLSAVQGDCDPGFLCYNAANTSQPTDGVTGESCPKGMYCDGGLSVGKTEL